MNTPDRNHDNARPCDQERADSLDQLAVQIEKRLIDRLRRNHGLRQEIERIAQRVLPTSGVQ